MRSNNNSGCLTAFISSFSRIMLLMVWIARPVMMNATFNTFILPCLGFMVLPFTTLMYVFLKQGVGTIQGLDWLWLFLAVLLDLASIGGAGVANRNRIPAGYPGSYAEKEYVAPSPVQPSAVPPPASAAPAAPATSDTSAAPAVPDQPVEPNP
jgi:hypothetical protein